MLFFGSETLRDFAFAMTIGLIIGCYSSIAVATPLYSMWKTREAKYAKIAKKYGSAIGVFEFDRGGTNTVGSLANSKSARIKTARVQAANAARAVEMHVDQAAEDEMLPIEEAPEGEAVIEGSAADPAVYQQPVHNPKKSKKKRKK